MRSADRERCVRMLDGDDERCDVRDDGLDNEFRPSFTLNFTFNMFTRLSVLFSLNLFDFTALLRCFPLFAFKLLLLLLFFRFDCVADSDDAEIFLREHNASISIKEQFTRCVRCHEQNANLFDVCSVVVLFLLQFVYFSDVF